MRYLAALSLLLASCTVCSCNRPLPKVVSGLIDCAETSVALAVPGAIAALNQALGGSDYRDAVDSLIAQVGEAAVACGLRQIVDDSAFPAASAEESPRLMRARELVESHAWTFAPAQQ